MSTALLDSTSGLTDGSDFNVGPSTADTAWEAHNIFATGAADIFLEVDSAGDGTFEVSVKVDTISSGGDMVMGALYELTADGSGNTTTRLRINNTSGSTIDVGVTGEDNA